MNGAQSLLPSQRKRQDNQQDGKIHEQSAVVEGSICCSEAFRCGRLNCTFRGTLLQPRIATEDEEVMFHVCTLLLAACELLAFSDRLLVDYSSQEEASGASAGHIQHIIIAGCVD